MTDIKTGPKVIKSDEEWRAELTPEQYRVLRKHGTEQAFSGPYWDEKTPGVYTCAACGAPLFSSETKYNSGTGWPSFWKPIAPDAVSEHGDWKLIMRRTEIRCANCNSHLGHVFGDGPPETGLRYCMNGTALHLEPKSDKSDDDS